MGVKMINIRSVRVNNIRRHSFVEKAIQQITGFSTIAAGERSFPRLQELSNHQDQSSDNNPLSMLWRIQVRGMANSIRFIDTSNLPIFNSAIFGIDIYEYFYRKRFNIYTLYSLLYRSIEKKRTILQYSTRKEHYIEKNHNKWKQSPIDI